MVAKRIIGRRRGWGNGGKSFLKALTRSRVFWCYGPAAKQIIFIAITPHL